MRMDTPDGHLFRAQSALASLGYFAAYLESEADTPPENFGFGLSVILRYIESDVTAAYNGITKKGRNNNDRKDIETKN